MEHEPIHARHLLLAYYVIHLIEGNTIKSLRIKHNTLRGYLNSDISLHVARELPDPSEPSFLKEDLISPLLQAVQSYEKVTKRKEMITDSMVATMLKLTSLSAPHSLEAAILDWILLGRFTGFRRSEWCQDKPGIEMTEVTIAQPTPEPKAFLASDFTFFDSSGNRIYDMSPSHVKNVDVVKIRWRFQKNKDNGQVIPYRRDYDRPTVCPVLAATRIILRSQALQVPPNEPIAVFASSSSSCQYKHIRASQVVKFLRRSAQLTFKLKPTDKALDNWTCHSIRVTAANILHRANMSDSYIQTRLRWKSNTFLMYLRNTFYSADQHTEAMKISNINLPHIPTLDGSRYRSLEDHEVIYSAHSVMAVAA